MRYSCTPFYPFEVWGAAVAPLAADILLLLRIFALYGRSKRVGLLLVFLWMVEAGAILGFVGASFEGLDEGTNPLPGILPGCFPAEGFRDILVLNTGAVAIPIQAVYLALTFYVMFRRFRTVGLLTNMTPLLNTFVRDGALYCTALLAMYILNLLFIRFQTHSPLETVGQSWEVAVVAVAAGRMVLNLRGSVQKPDNQRTEHSSTTRLTGRSRYDVELGQFTSVMEIDHQQTHCSSIISSSSAMFNER